MSKFLSVIIKRHWPIYFLLISVVSITTGAHRLARLSSSDFIISDVSEFYTPFDPQNEKDSSLPTNPVELMQRLNRINSMDDATLPSDAIDDALDAFNYENNSKTYR